MLRQEPMFYFRLRPEIAQRSLHVQLALGSSAAFSYHSSTGGVTTDPARQFRLGKGYVSLGLAFYPHLWWQKK
jgi:hypothetical protein